MRAAAATASSCRHLHGRSAEFTATGVGDADFIGFYGAGIVNALGVVR